MDEMRMDVIKSKPIQIHTSQPQSKADCWRDKSVCLQKKPQNTPYGCTVKVFLRGGGGLEGEMKELVRFGNIYGCLISSRLGGWFGSVKSRRSCRLLSKAWNVFLCPVESLQKHITGCFMSLMLLESVQLLSIWSQLQRPPDTIKGHIGVCVRV